MRSSSYLHVIDPNLPFFKSLQYLERRFSFSVRMLGSTVFVIQTVCIPQTNSNGKIQHFENETVQPGGYIYITK